MSSFLHPRALEDKVKDKKSPVGSRHLLNLFLTLVPSATSITIENEEEARTLSRARSTGSKRKTDSGHCARDQAFLTFGRPYLLLQSEDVGSKVGW